MRRFVNSPFGVYQNLLNGTMNEWKNDFTLQLFTDFSPCAGDRVRLCRYLYVRAFSSPMGTMHVNATSARNYAPLSRLI